MSNVKKHLLGILCVMFSAIGLVIILAWEALKPINQKSGFIRNSLASVEPIQTIDRNEEITDIVQAKSTRIYFKTKDPAKLYFTDGELKKGRFGNLLVPNQEKISSAFTIFIDSTDISIFAHNVPALVRTYVNSINSTVTKLNFPIFSQVAKISDNTFIGRGFEATVKGDQLFYKGDIKSSTIDREKGISQFNHDGGISTDGYLSYDSSTATILFVSYYSNSILAIDTNLNLMHRTKTIDTINSVPQIGEALSGNLYTSTAPTRVVNNLGCASNGILFNHSKLRADNDSEIFGSSSAIDLYNIRKGSYLGTIYLKRYKRETLSSFKVFNNYLVALYKSKIVLYKLPYLQSLN